MIKFYKIDFLLVLINYYESADIINYSKTLYIYIHIIRFVNPID